MSGARDEALARLAGGVAHDFNNLLTVILGYADLVTHDLGPEHPSAPDLAEIRRAGEQARALVDQLLTLSRHRVARAQHVDPSGTLVSLHEMIRALAGPDVAVDLRPSEAGRVLIDSGQLEHVILHLVINAGEAMPEGGRLTISAAAGQLPDQRPSVDLRVSDTGSGMDEATATRCFEPFFTTKDRTEGTGLGLATVAAIVEGAGGRISLETAPGRGATFVVQLPAVALEAREESVDPETAAHAERVLIVEDDDKVRGFARRVLEQHGYVASDAASGVDALAVLQSGGLPDLLVTDVLMPAMGGVELVERVHEVAPEVPVLFVSGYADDPRLHHLAREVPFLAKPFSPPDLIRAVRAAIDGGTSADQGSNR